MWTFSERSSKFSSNFLSQFSRIFLTIPNISSKFPYVYHRLESFQKFSKFFEFFIKVVFFDTCPTIHSTYHWIFHKILKTVLFHTCSIIHSTYICWGISNFFSIPHVKIPTENKFSGNQIKYLTAKLLTVTLRVVLA